MNSRTMNARNSSASCESGDDLDDVQLLRPIKAAGVLDISERSLWTLTKEREIPSIKIGRSVRYRLADLREYVRRKHRENL